MFKVIVTIVMLMSFTTSQTVLAQQVQPTPEHLFLEGVIAVMDQAQLNPKTFQLDVKSNEQLKVVTEQYRTTLNHDRTSAVQNLRQAAQDMGIYSQQFESGLSQIEQNPGATQAELQAQLQTSVHGIHLPAGAKSDFVGGGIMIILVLALISAFF